MLSSRQNEFYDENGYLVFERMIAPEACDRLRARAEQLVDDFDATESRSVFSTKNRTQDRDSYFLSSGSNISFFFEEDAFAPDGSLRQPKARSLNKFGHAMHDLDPEFDRFSRHPRIAEIVAGLGVTDPRLLQSMYIFKQPRIGGEVVPHQDAAFLVTEPMSVVGLWFALEDADRDNGCLWVLPGGHRGSLRQRFRRDATGSTRLDTLDGSPYPVDDGVALEVPKGTMVVLHGLLPHWSAPNRSERSRHAYTLHVIDGSATYPADNWLQRPDDFPLKGF